jgi:transposase-like protein
MPRWRRATVVWLRPDAARPDLAYLPFEHVNTDMIYATTVTEVVARHKAFARKWRLKCPAVAASLEEAGGRLFTFLHCPPEQWKSLRTTNAVERLHEEFKRRIKTQYLLPCAETACMLF